MRQWPLFASSFVLVTFAIACGSDAGGTGDTDAGAGDGGHDATNDVAADNTVPGDDASDAADTAPPEDANDGGSADANDGGSADANDGGSADANDGGSADANDGSAAADGSDAADASQVIACTPVTNLGTIYYSRSPITLADGGISSNGELWTVRGDGTQDTKIGEGDAPRLSPSGRYLAFKRGTANSLLNDLYIRDLSITDGAPADTLLYANGGQYILGYGFSGDSTKLFFDWGNDVHRIDVSGANDVVFSSYMDTSTATTYAGYSDAPQASWVDGRVSFHNYFDGLALAQTDGGTAHIPNTMAAGTSSAPSASGGDFWPSWTPDGQWLVFLHLASPAVGFTANQGAVYKIHPDGSGRTLLTPTVADGDGFRWGGTVSADGTMFVGSATFYGVQGIYTVSLDGSGTLKRVCTTDGALVDWVGSVTAP